jgi:hypothetical protein
MRGDTGYVRESHYFAGGPGNKRDRARFAALTDDRKAAVSRQAETLYDGSRTVARCWVEALDAEQRGVALWAYGLGA